MPDIEISEKLILLFYFMPIFLLSLSIHEYAHALMFKQGYMHTKDDGHSSLWQKTCVKLGGEDCQQYVNQQEIIMSKMPF